jgi:hypothetical protein
MTPPPIDQSVQCIAMGTPRKNRKKFPGHSEPTLRVRIILATGHSHPPKPPVLGRPPSGRSRFIGYAHIFCSYKNISHQRVRGERKLLVYQFTGETCSRAASDSQRTPLPAKRCPVANYRPATFAEVPCKKARRVRAAGAAWRCARRTAPGSRSPTPWPAGTAWKSGTPVPDVRRSGSVPDRR